MWIGLKYNRIVNHYLVFQILSYVILKLGFMNTNRFTLTTTEFISNINLFFLVKKYIKKELEHFKSTQVAGTTYSASYGGVPEPEQLQNKNKNVCKYHFNLFYITEAEWLA
jgi:hypothetical protein